MSASLNKVMVIGNVGRDPEIRHTGDGKAIANVTVATTENWKDRSGERQEKTEWHRVVVFGGLADVVSKYVKKGDPVYFEGKLQTRKWTDNQGQERYTTEIVVDNFGGAMQMLSRRGGGDSSYSQSAPADDFGSSQQAAQPAVAAKQISDDAPFDDEIPF
ncbi:MAG: single-stranded DNA-binding protein [Alphaproteobacteria bacterium]|nr:single-stranded DNA-binding protein [Alphaproteobacteria bacterium]MDD9919202.1 single-stranded DNA-binding protein [Alphaproteobacteria bacterium]